MAFFISRNVSFPLIALTLFASKEINIIRIIKIHLGISLILFTLVIGLAVFDFMPSTNIIDTRNIDGIHVLRYNLGFGSPNGAFIYYLPILTSAIFLVRNLYLKVIIYLVLFSVAIAIHYYTLSRTGFFSSIVLFVLLWILPFAKFEKLSFFRFIFKNIIAFFLLITLLIATLFNNPTFNEILAFRPGYWLLHFLQEVYQYNLWGYPWNPYYQDLVSSVPMDNSYLAMVLSKGIIFSIFIYVLYKIGLTKLIFHQQYKKIAISLAILVFGLFENILFIVGFNISLFILYHEIIHQKKTDLNE